MGLILLCISQYKKNESTLTNKSYKCVDKPVSIDEKQMTKLVKELDILSKILGNKKMGIREVEKGAKQFRRIIK